MDCYDQQTGSKLVEMCVNNMLPDLENLNICQFGKLIDAARKTALTVRLLQRGKEKENSGHQTLVATENQRGRGG